ncbi:glycoside hydrolase family protein [Candidatus Pacearchaeota archaeon]|nr:glycoside hydrolase family protein [Candidatus Pacearchaeota archaeon]
MNKVTKGMIGMAGFLSVVAGGFLYSIQPSSKPEDTYDPNWVPPTLGIQEPAEEIPTTQMSKLEEKVQSLSKPLIRQESYRNELRTRLKVEEGYKPVRYFDTEKIPTIGIGFNLKRKDAPHLIQSVGANYNEILQGKEALSQDQIYTLFEHDLREAEKHARHYIHDYDSKPDAVKVVVADMMFNLGPRRFEGFQKFITAINKGDYQTAAQEMKDSKWYHQTKTRGPALYKLMKSVDSSRSSRE